jgi:hypothetical protein
MEQAASGRLLHELDDVEEVPVRVAHREHRRRALEVQDLGIRVDAAGQQVVVVGIRVLRRQTDAGVDALLPPCGSGASAMVVAQPRGATSIQRRSPLKAASTRFSKPSLPT